MKVWIYYYSSDNKRENNEAITSLVLLEKKYNYISLNHSIHFIQLIPFGIVAKHIIAAVVDLQLQKKSHH